MHSFHRFSGFAFGIFLLAGISPGSRAQVVEYEMPEEFELLPGVLAVTFLDTAPVDSAMSALASLPARITAMDFHPVLIAGRTLWPLRAGLLDSLRSTALVSDVLQGRDLLDMGTTGSYIRERVPEAAEDLLRGLVVVMDTHTSEEAARTLAGSLQDFELLRIDRRPNEATISFEEEDEQAILDALETSPIVEYVSYVAAQ